MEVDTYNEFRRIELILEEINEKLDELTGKENKGEDPNEQPIKYEEET